MLKFCLSSLVINCLEMFTCTKKHLSKNTIAFVTNTTLMNEEVNQLLLHVYIYMYQTVKHFQMESVNVSDVWES